MSHTARHQTKCANPELIEAACSRMDDAKFLGRTRAYGGEGTGVKFKRWYHQCLFTESGEMLFDSDDSGRLNDLNLFKQQYQVAAAHAAWPHATITEQTLDNGELELTVQLAGGYSV